MDDAIFFFFWMMPFSHSFIQHLFSISYVKESLEIQGEKINIPKRTMKKKNKKGVCTGIEAGFVIQI